MRIVDTETSLNLNSWEYLRNNRRASIHSRASMIDSDADARPILQKYSRRDLNGIASVTTADDERARDPAFDELNRNLSM